MQNYAPICQNTKEKLNFFALYLDIIQKYTNFASA